MAEPCARQAAGFRAPRAEKKPVQELERKKQRKKNKKKKILGDLGKSWCFSYSIFTASTLEMNI